MKQRLDDSSLAVKSATFRLQTFENEPIGHGLANTWHFELELDELGNTDEFAISGAAIEWVPAAQANWRELLGSVIEFVDPVEATLYDGTHNWLQGRLEIVSVHDDSVTGQLKGSAALNERAIELQLKFEARFEGWLVPHDLWPADLPKPPEAIRGTLGSMAGFGEPELRTNRFGVTHWWFPPAVQGNR